MSNLILTLLAPALSATCLEKPQNPAVCLLHGDAKCCWKQSHGDVDGSTTNSQFPSAALSKASHFPKLLSPPPHEDLLHCPQIAHLFLHLLWQPHLHLHRETRCHQNEIPILLSPCSKTRLHTPTPFIPSALPLTLSIGSPLPPLP